MAIGLKALQFTDITDPTPEVTVLNWASTRPNELSNFIDSNNLEVSFTDTSSPPNVYITSYTVPIPAPILAVQIGFSFDITVSWGSSSGSDQYLLQRADNASFVGAVDVYTGSNLSTIDTVISEGPWYYRVLAQVTTLTLESYWSATASVTLVLLDCDFVGTPLSGSAPLGVQFTDTSTGSPTGWLWEFGDTQTSVLQDPLHSYSAPGTYTVKLTVTRGISSADKTRTDYVVVSASPPVADFTADHTSGDYPLTVQFTDTSVSAHTLVGWTWDFGDGGTSTEQNPTHIYNVAGTYTVTLTVEDEFSQTDTEIKTDYITVGDLFLVVDFVGVPRRGVSPLVVDFTNLTTLPAGHTLVTWQWDFGDGETSSEGNPTHIYLGRGYFTVTLRAVVEI